MKRKCPVCNQLIEAKTVIKHAFVDNAHKEYLTQTLLENRRFFKIEPLSNKNENKI